MDFPITEHEIPSRHATGSSLGRAGVDSRVGAFADLLAADRFSDAPDGPTFDHIQEDLDALASRDDQLDDEAAHDDDADQEAGTDDARDETRDDTGEDSREDDPARVAKNDGADTETGADGTDNEETLTTGIVQAAQVGANLVGEPGAAGAESAAMPTAAAQVTDPRAGTSPGEDALAGNPAAASTVAAAANLSEARVLSRRAHTLQGNAQHVAAVKSQVAKAENASADTTARTAETAKPATPTPDATQPKTEASRLEQAFRAAFPQAANTPAATPNPAQPSTPVLAQNGAVADGLLQTSIGDGGDHNPQVQNNAERTNNMVATKAAATRSPFTLPGSRPAEQVSVQIQNAARNGTDKISIRLSPAALGKVEVKLDGQKLGEATHKVLLQRKHRIGTSLGLA